MSAVNDAARKAADRHPVSRGIRQALDGWDPGHRPSFREVAERLNEVGYLTPRQNYWYGTLLYTALDRAGVGLEGIVQWTDTGQRFNLEQEIQRARDESLSRQVERVRVELLAWAREWNSKECPPPLLVVRELNSRSSINLLNRPWTKRTLESTLARLGWGVIENLLYEVGWDPRFGKYQPVDWEAVERGDFDVVTEEDRRHDAALAAHAAILREQPILGDEEVAWLAAYEGISEEEALLRSIDVSADVAGDLPDIDVSGMPDPG